MAGPNLAGHDCHIRYGQQSPAICDKILYPIIASESPAMMPMASPPGAAPASPPPVYQLAFFWFKPKKKGRQVQLISGRPLVQLPSRKGDRPETDSIGRIIPTILLLNCCPLCLPFLPSHILSHRTSCHIFLSHIFLSQI